MISQLNLPFVSSIVETRGRQRVSTALDTNGNKAVWEAQRLTGTV